MKTLICIWVAFLGAVTMASAQAKVADKSSNEIPSPVDYVLLSGDVLRVQIYNEPELTREGLKISQEYSIQLPLIGKIDLKGKTLRQAEDMIRDLYNRDYLVNPQVNVMVTAYAERTVNVLGRVKSAGPIPFPQEHGLKLVDAIARAGGPDPLADMTKVRLTRTQPDGTTKVEVIDVKKILDNTANNKNGQNDWPLVPGDTITVPEIFMF
jgi:protein involved in polysaccharide export with SLBB domain